MAREIKRVTIREHTGRGRDTGKIFELTEMPADQAERWCTRMALALCNAGAKVPDGVVEAGGAAALEITWRHVLATGITALQGLSEAAVRPLLEELKPCMTWCPPGNSPVQPIFPGVESQVEEFMTWYTLYFEYVQLLLGFSEADVSLTTGTTPQTPPAS